MKGLQILLWNFDKDTLSLNRTLDTLTSYYGIKNSDIADSIGEIEASHYDYIIVGGYALSNSPVPNKEILRRKNLIAEQLEVKSETIAFDFEIYNKWFKFPKVCLVIIFNHRYDRNLPLLREIYGKRFSNIRFLMPFYDGADEDVIPVYESSYKFQGYLIQAYEKLKNIECSHYLFCADDLILHPELDETNFLIQTNMQDKKFLAKAINPFNSSGIFFWNWMSSPTKSFYSRFITWKNSLYTYDEAMAKFKDFFGVEYKETYEADFFGDPNKPGVNEFGRWTKAEEHARAVKQFINSNGGSSKIPYPMACCSYGSDIFCVAKDKLFEFSRLCGIFSAMGLMCEISTPTAVVLTFKRDEVQYFPPRSLDFNRREAKNRFDKYSGDFKRLYDEWEDNVLGIHPIKLSAWKVPLSDFKYLILGAGVAGLTFANCLKRRGEHSFLVLERNSEGGGLCRTVYKDGTPIDIGGGHFLDVRRPNVVKFLFKFMPESEWDKYVRDSQIALDNITVNHPIEANLWQFPPEEQMAYLESIAKAGCNNGDPMPKKFVDWIRWKLGDKITDEYMLPYNKKMFGDNLNELGTYWLEKLPSVSFKETIRSCMEKKAYGKQPGHSEFYYPKKFGYGEVWLRMAKNIANHIEYGKTVSAIDFNTNTVTTADGSRYTADKIITTIPWHAFDEMTGIPAELVTDIQKLKYTAIQVKYSSENLDSKAQWTYFPSPELSYHRIIYQHNINAAWKGYWTETRVSCEEGGRLASPLDDTTFVNDYAYPLNTIDKPKIMERLLTWCREKNVYGLGRWGEHCHYNSDVTAELAMKLAERL